MKMQKLALALTVILGLSLIFFQPTATKAQQLQMQKGLTLSYKAIRGSTVSTNYQTSDIIDTILESNNTIILYQRHYTTPQGSGKIKITILYTQDAPTFVTYLPALTYLPPKTLQKTLQKNLDWTKNVATSQEWVQVEDSIAETLNMTVQAGTFQCLNLTLTITGWEPGNLSLIYDLASGIMVYQKWATREGEIITQELISTATKTEKPSIIFTVILFLATILIPAVTSLDQTRKKLLKNEKSKQYKTEEPIPTLKNGFPKKPFYITLIGAFLILTSVFLPWSQLVDLVYLPLSLPSALTEYRFPTSTAIFFTISLLAHVAAILAWLSIALHIYARKRLTSQLVTLTSSILAFSSALIFIQTGWTPSWGLPLTVIGGILAIAGIAIANIKIEIVTEETENTIT